MALFSFQSGRKAVENDIPNFSAKRQKVLVFLFCQSGNEAVKNGSFLELKAAEKRLKIAFFNKFEAGRKRREIFPAKQGKYREKQGISFKF